MAEEVKSSDPSSPYYLSTGDQPGNLVTRVILKGNNYVAWSRALKLALRARRKFGFIDGTIQKPTDDAKLVDWTTVNAMLVSWILRSMDPKVSSGLPFYDSAKKLWDDLEKRMCISNGPRIQELRASIASCKQSKGMSIEEYYIKLMSLWDDLLRLKPPHGCTCGLCTCDVVGCYATDLSEAQLHQFLIGVDDDLYAAVRTNILSQDPVPTLDRSYQIFIQEKRSRVIARATSLVNKDEIHAFGVHPVVAPSFVSRAPSLIPRPGLAINKSAIDKLTLSCLHCHKGGHDISSCFKLHGYPEWWDEIKTRGVARVHLPDVLLLEAVAVVVLLGPT